MTAAQVFITPQFAVRRADIMQAINRLSSAVYVMMILGVTDSPPTLSQLQQHREVKMIIDQCRKLALRAPPGVVVPGCAGRPCAEGGALSAAAGPGASDPRRQSLRAAAVRPWRTSAADRSADH